MLLCGACFSVGYNMGRKATPTPLALNDASPDAVSSDSTSGGAKPSAGSPADGTTAGELPPTIAAAPPAPKPSPVVRKPAPVVTDTDAALPTEASKSATTLARTSASTKEAAPAPIVRAVPPSALLPGASTTSTANNSGNGTGSIMVQIAAVSHQEDADLHEGALRSRGYSVTARPASSDGFIHVQVGPFSDKKAAEAMKQRLLADGYNAILK